MNEAANQQIAAQSLSSRMQSAIMPTSFSSRQAAAHCSHASAQRTQASRQDWKDVVDIPHPLSKFSAWQTPIEEIGCSKLPESSNFLVIQDVFQAAARDCELLFIFFGAAGKMSSVPEGRNSRQVVSCAT
jgi:hypothetical protein